MKQEDLEERIAAMSELLTAADIRISKLETFVQRQAELLVAEKRISGFKVDTLMYESRLIEEAARWTR